jgi:hypothetical protein
VRTCARVRACMRAPHCGVVCAHRQEPHDAVDVEAPILPTSRRGHRCALHCTALHCTARQSPAAANRRTAPPCVGGRWRRNGRSAAAVLLLRCVVGVAVDPDGFRVQLPEWPGAARPSSRQALRRGALRRPPHVRITAHAPRTASGDPSPRPPPPAIAASRRPQASRPPSLSGASTGGPAPAALRTAGYVEHGAELAGSRTRHEAGLLVELAQAS